jgi:hypothetical protein
MRVVRRGMASARQHETARSAAEQRGACEACALVRARSVVCCVSPPADYRPTCLLARDPRRHLCAQGRRQLILLLVHLRAAELVCIAPRRVHAVRREGRVGRDGCAVVGGEGQLGRRVWAAAAGGDLHSELTTDLVLPK